MQLRESPRWFDSRKLVGYALQPNTIEGLVATLNSAVRRLDALITCDGSQFPGLRYSRMSGHARALHAKPVKFLVSGFPTRQGQCGDFVSAMDERRHRIVDRAADRGPARFESSARPDGRRGRTRMGCRDHEWCGSPGVTLEKDAVVTRGSGNARQEACAKTSGQRGGLIAMLQQ
jgi:hypothetical protein